MIILGNPINNLEHVIDKYVQFSSANSFQMRVGEGATDHLCNGTLEWSNDAQHWTPWGNRVTLSSGTFCGKHRIFIRGTGNTHVNNTTAGSTANGWHFNGSGIKVSGNIASLLDWRTVMLGGLPAADASSFSCLFAINDAQTAYIAGITDAKDFILPYMTLEYEFYTALFQNNKNLISAPVLPATTLSTYCYAWMFTRCSLTTAPTIHASTIPSYGCCDMFMYCSKLTTAPSLSATSVGAYGCFGMFEECSSLANVASVASVTSVGDSGLARMFTNCYKLTAPSAIKATSIGSYAFADMFYMDIHKGTSSLNRLPALPATTIPTYAYAAMFSGSSVKLSTSKTGSYNYAFRMPTSGTGTAGSNAFWEMFASTKGTWMGTPSVNTTYYTDHPLIT